MSGASGKQLNVIGAVVVVLCLVAGMFLILFVLGYARRQARSMKSTPQIRGITQSMVTYGEGNKEYFPGLNVMGEVIDVSVEHRYWILLDGNYFSGEYAISPSETKTAWTTGLVSSVNYSFAMLQLDGDVGMKLNTGRCDEWRATVNSQAVVTSDRNTGSDANADVQSIHSQTPGSWAGWICRNDGSAAFEKTHLLETRYGKAGKLNTDDNLFEAAGTDDAYMIYEGD